MHNHDHSHAAGSHRHEGRNRNVRRLRLALLIILAFFLVEVAGALYTGSLALLADAGHMLSDVAALLLALFAMWIARRPARTGRTFGFYRIEVLAAAANALALLAISVYIFLEAYRRLSEPPAVASGPMLIVAVAGLLANIAAAMVLHGGSQESINMRGAFLHVITDTMGSVGAILAAAIMHLTGWYYADPLISGVIGLLVLFSGGRLLRDTMEILLEAAPDHLDLAEIERSLLTVPGVIGVHDLHVWTITSGFLSMSGHLSVAAPDDGAILAQATTLLRERFGLAHSTIQIEAPTGQAKLPQGCVAGELGCGCPYYGGEEPAAPH